MPKTKYQNAGNEYHWVFPRSENQKRLVESIFTNSITLVSGPSGTGKTLLTLQEALKAYSNGQIKKIYYLRNNCETSELGSKGRGELPGTILEKALPLLGPIVDNLFEIVSEGKAKYMIEKGVIEPLYYEDLRGRSLISSFVIADEAQSVPPKGVKTLLTRIGRGTKMVLLGDYRQKDTADRYGDGLMDACSRLIGIPGIGIVHFGIEDIQRHGIIKDILIRYGDF
jgi:phosphate starvation-inducible PhoH-like protein